MRRVACAVLAAGCLVSISGAVRADGRCDLNTVVGYQLVFGKPIEAYIEGGTVKQGYVGCAPDRVLVFSDHTGVKCKSVVMQTVSGSLPTGFLFAKSLGDMRLCVDGEMFPVSQTN